MNTIHECQVNIGLKFELDPEQPEELRKLAEWVKRIPRVFAPDELPVLSPERVGQGYAMSGQVPRGADLPLLQITSISLSSVGRPMDESILKILMDGMKKVGQEWRGERSELGF